MLPTLLWMVNVMAQVERVEPLHAQPRLDAAAALRSGGGHEYFIYRNDTTELPVVDDFSVDRTRHHDATNADANVTYYLTVYRFTVNGISTPDMAFRADTTYHLTVDTVGVDTTITVPNPSISVVVSDLSTYPTTTTTVDYWPTYAITDTVGDPTSDTTHLTPDLYQDSLVVYTVAPDGRLYVNPDNTTRPYILWEDDEAYINSTYPVEPPTIGVATFDGMDRTGYPYMPESPNQNGVADHLTSVPINLLYDAGDSIYLSFLYQARGLSGDNELQEEDSLRLEFYAPELQEWDSAWSTPYVPLAPFKNVLVPIKLNKHLKKGFRIRFSNKATLGGAVDQWHIDYVRIGRFRNYQDTVIQDVAWTYPANTLLAPYTSVPFNKFTADPTHYMANTVDLHVRNLYPVDAFITDTCYTTGDCGAQGELEHGVISLNGNASSTFTRSVEVNSGGSPFTYDLSACSDAAFMHGTFVVKASPDAMRYNDTTAFTQEISNYYSYDDGSAEAGYWLNYQGGQIAYRFDTQGDDSLRAVRMYFDPIFSYGDVPNDPRDGNFLITVWSDLNNQPIYQNVSFSTPDYHRWGPNYFVEYPLDQTIHVAGSFYVGWSQTNAIKMNLGLDKNRVNNDRMYYNVGNGWVQSSTQGSWMIRPVMVSAVDPYAGVEAPERDPSMLVFPNPSTGAVNIRLSGASLSTIEVTDITGRVIERQRWNGADLRVEGLSPAVYLVRAVDQQGHPISQQRLVVQR